MIVAINGEFHLQDEDDYKVNESTKKLQLQFDEDNNNNNNNNNNRNSSIKSIETTISSTPPSEEKQKQDSSTTTALHRPYPSATRPKSSDSGRRTITSYGPISSSVSDDNRKRPTRYARNKFIHIITYEWCFFFLVVLLFQDL